MKIFLFSVLTVIAITLVAADSAPGPLSRLACGPTIGVVPQGTITCTITVFDGSSEATTAQATDFIIMAQDDSGAGGVTATLLTMSANGRVGTFTVTPRQAGSVVVSATLRSSGLTIAGSGQRIPVLAVPVRYFSEFICVRTSMSLRESVNCSANAFGANDIPAYVYPQDVEVTIAAGTVVVYPTPQHFLMTYTAPILMPSGQTVTISLRVKGGASGSYTVNLLLKYPVLPADENSKVFCSSSTGDILCTVQAFDFLGPIRINVPEFGVTFQSPYDKIMSASWTPGDDEHQAQLTALASRHDKVFSSTMTVFLAHTAFSIKGSPFSFSQGVAPTAASASIASCDDSIFIVPGGSTNCSVEVSPEVTADAEYFDISTTAGSVSTLRYYQTSATSHGLTFTFTAPVNIVSRADILVSIKINNTEIRNSPRRFVVYADRMGEVDMSAGSGGDYSSVVVVGSLVFFGMIATTIIVVAVKKRKQYELRKSNRLGTPQGNGHGATQH